MKCFHRAYGNRLSRDEYESAALLGAIQAAQQYDSRKGSFPNWAIRYIDGAIKADLWDVQAGVVHVPRDALRAEGHPTYTDLDTARVVAPDPLTKALEAAEDAVAMQTVKSRVKRILTVLKKHLPDRALQVYLLIAGEERSLRETARALDIGTATVGRDYRQAVTVVTDLKATHMLKAQRQTTATIGALAGLHAAALRAAKLSRRYALLQPYQNALPGAVVTRARDRAQDAVRDWLRQDRAVAEALLSPPTIAGDREGQP